MNKEAIFEIIKEVRSICMSPSAFAALKLVEQRVEVLCETCGGSKVLTIAAGQGVDIPCPDCPPKAAEIERGKVAMNSLAEIHKRECFMESSASDKCLGIIEQALKGSENEK